MIAKLTGKIIGKTDRALVLEVGGVGYEINTTAEVLSGASEGAAVTFYTYLNVRENLMELFGFTTREELAFFKLLLGVSGIGPRSALNILEAAKPNDIRQAVVNQDASSLHAVHGLGKKTAEKLVVELRDKLEAGVASGLVGDNQAVLEAIINLGYSPTEARQAVKTIKDQAGDLVDKVKAALKALSRT